MMILKCRLPNANRVTICLLHFALCACLLVVTSKTSFAENCAGTIAEQDAWVHRNVDLLIRRARAAYEEEKAERAYARTLGSIANRLQQCKFNSEPSFVARYPEFVEYVRVLSLDQQPGHDLGFEVSDGEYFAETKSFVSIPDFLLSPELLTAVRRYETLPEAKAILRSINETRPANEQLLFFSYESRHLGTPDSDNSYRRLLIVVPGNSEQKIPEKWVQFGIPDPRARKVVRNLSVVAVVRGPENITNTYFKDYFRTYRRSGPVTIKGRWELGEGDDNCVKCHKSGVLPIFPVEGSVSGDEKLVVEEVNKRFLRYGAPRFGRYLDATKFGPGLGSIRLSSYTRHQTPYSGNCTSCHQPNSLGWLNWPMDSVLISSFVESGRMPLDAELKGWESSALYAQIIDDYFSIDQKRPGILKTWLLGLKR